MAKPITEERILQISNNVSEEWADHSQVDFATKAELCQVVQYWQRKSDDNWNRLMGLRGDMTLLLIEALNPDLRSVAPEQTEPTAHGHEFK